MHSSTFVLGYNIVPVHPMAAKRQLPLWVVLALQRVATNGLPTSPQLLLGVTGLDHREAKC